MPGLRAGSPALTAPHRPRPVGLARGASAFALTWFGGLIIALLTGATAVVILLAVGLVAGVAGAVSGLAALRGSDVRRVRTASVATAGEELHWLVTAAARRPVHAVVAVDGEEVARGWLADGTTRLEGRAPRRGVHHEAVVRWSAAGRFGAVWWSRHVTVRIDPLHSGPVADAVPAPSRRLPEDLVGVAAPSAGVGHDDVDGVRQWRDGDEVTAVHWPSTVRTGEFVVRHRTRERAEEFVVDARTGTADPDLEAGRVRRAVEDCLSRGAAVAVSVDGGPADDLPSVAAAVQWCAAFDLRPAGDEAVPWWRREVRRLPDPEPDHELTATARWLAALAVAVPFVMMLQALGYGSAEYAVVVAALGLAAFVTAWRPPVRAGIRQAGGLAVGVAVGLTLVDIGDVGDVMTAMRFLMPQLLIALGIVQGFECIDRRGARVHLACGAVLMLYASGVRVDDSLGGFMLAGTVLIGVATVAITAPDRARRTAVDADAPAPSRRRHAAGQAVGSAVALASVVAVLAVVPVPKGPAQLNLPTWLPERRQVDSPGDLSNADGSALLGGALQGPLSRNGGGPGGYPGFSTEMNTSLRGDLGDSVVLRVRAPAPAFWRGQTFTIFDGTTWYVETVTGTPSSEGNDHFLPPAEGDLDLEGVEPNFVQTFYVEQDMPNILFVAPQASRILLDGTIFYRPDGALRAAVTLPKGSVYTVLSNQPRPTADQLRQESFDRWTFPPKYLQVPRSTSERTKALARQLAAGSPSVYDTIIRIEDWLGAHVQYDLDAPVPPDGANAVDHFLFESQRGFCEQIATATAIMLRSLGIPTRIATGYVPGERDAIAGTYISRARDAHAWVEVWFPEFGWVPFDPTASVPLAGEADLSTIGGALLQLLGTAIGDHVQALIVAVVGGAALVLAVRALVAWWRRRRRGRWGVLQDRFVAAAVARGADPNAPNATLAAASGAEEAKVVARILDECAFSPTWFDDDALYAHAKSLLDSLPPPREPELARSPRT